MLSTALPFLLRLLSAPSPGGEEDLDDLPSTLLQDTTLQPSVLRRVGELFSESVF